MASVLTPYKSSNGNNPYTTEQLKELWKNLDPESRAPGSYTIEERVTLQRLFLGYIENGYTATRAANSIKDIAAQNPGKVPYADYATFMAWKEFDKNFADAYEVAYAMGTDKLEDKGVDMAYGGNAAMLQFLLKMRNRERYEAKSSGEGSGNTTVVNVNRIELIAAPAKVLEHESDEASSSLPNRITRSPDVIDAEILDP